MIVDVRTPGEFAASHLEGAYNYDANSDEFIAAIGELERDPKILIYGGDDVALADRAVIAMGNMGFRNLYRLIGGITVWTEAGNPVIRDIPETSRPPEGTAAAEPVVVTPPSPDPSLKGEN
jgi:rhodanese-related sulfurtransferase